MPHGILVNAGVCIDIVNTCIPVFKYHYLRSMHFYTQIYVYLDTCLFDFTHALACLRLS